MSFCDLRTSMDPCYTPQTKRQSKQWTLHGEPTNMKAKTTLLAEKVITSVLLDS